MFTSAGRGFCSFSLYCVLFIITMCFIKCIANCYHVLFAYLPTKVKIGQLFMRKLHKQIGIDTGWFNITINSSIIS